MNRRYGIVTGAASGIGRAICVRLAADGWHLAVADVNAEASADTARMVEQAGGSAQVERLDVRSDESWTALRARLQADWPRLDLLVNNAGVAVTGKVDETPMADWDWLLSINLRGVIVGCHTMVPWLKENPGAAVMNMASVAGLIGPARLGAYNVSKAGVIALSETLYQELKPHDVSVTVVCPWFVQTKLLERGRFADPLDKQAGVELMQGSRLTPERVADRAVRAMYRRRLYEVVGFRARQCSSMKRHWPRLFIALSEWVQRRWLWPAWERRAEQREETVTIETRRASPAAKRSP